MTDVATKNNYENIRAGNPCECGSSNITQKMTLYVDPTDLATVDVCDGYMEAEYYCDGCGSYIKRDGTTHYGLDGEKDLSRFVNDTGDDNEPTN